MVIVSTINFQILGVKGLKGGGGGVWVGGGRWGYLVLVNLTRFFRDFPSPSNFNLFSTIIFKI